MPNFAKLATSKNAIKLPLLLSALLATVSTACQDDGSVNDAGNNVVFTRADGTKVEFSSAARLHVWCGPWEEGVPTPTFHVQYLDPAGPGPYWSLRAVLADMTPGKPLTFPNSFVWDQPRGATLFLVDGENELSSAERESTGSVTPQRVSCQEGETIAFTVDAHLGSELADLPPVDASGTFHAPVGRAPDGLTLP